MVYQCPEYNHPVCFYACGLTAAQLLWGLLRHWTPVSSAFGGCLLTSLAMVSWLMPHFSVISVDSQKGEMYSYLYLTMWQVNQWWLSTMIKTGHSFCNLEARCNYLKKPSHSVAILPRKVYCSSFWMEKILWSHMEAMQYCPGLSDLESIDADFLQWTKFFCSFTFWKYIIFLFHLLSLPPSFPFSLSSG